MTTITLAHAQRLNYIITVVYIMDRQWYTLQVVPLGKFKLREVKPLKVW